MLQWSEKQAPLRTKLNPSALGETNRQVYNEADFQRIVALIRSEAGIVLNETKQLLAYSRIAPLVRDCGLQTFSEFLDLIDDDPDRRMLAVASLTTNHTYFYREPRHFDHFKQIVRPALLNQAAAQKSVRIWSAGCSSGEEIYTLLMVLLGEDSHAGNRVAKQNILAVASDIAGHALNAAETAIYPADAIARLPAKLGRSWTEASSDGDLNKRSISPVITRMVQFRQHSLLRPWPFNSHFDVIFCRNVLIYFDEADKAGLVLKFAHQLKPGGHLYIGHSERIPETAKQLLEQVGSTIFRRRTT